MEKTVSEIIKQYCLKPGFTFHQLDTERAILLHEIQPETLISKLCVRVLSEISDNQNLDRLAGDVPPAEIYYALSQLKRMGYIISRDEHTKNISWLTSSEYGDSMAELLHDTVAIESTSEYYKKLMHDELTDAGFKKIGSAADSKVTIVICNDYLEPSSSQLQGQAFEMGTSYVFPVKVSGMRLGLGPLFKKGQKPCRQCLDVAIRKNRPVQNYLSDNTLKPLITEYPVSPALLKIGLNAAIMQMMRKMLMQNNGDSELITLDMWDMSIDRHHIRVRPQCFLCGEPSLFSAQVTSPVVLADSPRKYSDNGGYRIVDPETTWNNYRHLVSPITGIISHIDKCDKKDHKLRPVWKATYFVNPKNHKPDKSELFVRNSFGKGYTSEQSRASALCEAVERYSFLYTGEEPAVFGSYNRLVPYAVNPDKLQFFSSSQFAARDCQKTGLSKQKIACPFDPDKELYWTPVWSVTGNKLRYLPLEYCYSMTPVADKDITAPFSSNGNAAGNSIEEAILQGFLELVERDAVAIWWYNRIVRPQINIESFNDKYFSDVKQHYNDLGWDLWLLDLTHDLQIPVAAALAKNKINGYFSIGLGAHLSMQLAVERAITEMHQTFDPQGTHDPVWTEDHIEIKDFLYPAADGIITNEMYNPPPVRSIKDDILDCADRVEKAGLEFLILNSTRPDIKVPVVKVIVPGLRHFWKQMGPGRLYRVPVKMGWIEKEISEDSMNPKELAL